MRLLYLAEVDERIAYPQVGEVILIPVMIFTSPLCLLLSSCCMYLLRSIIIIYVLLKILFYEIFLRKYAIFCYKKRWGGCIYATKDFVVSAFSINFASAFKNYYTLLII